MLEGTLLTAKAYYLQQRVV